MAFTTAYQLPTQAERTLKTQTRDNASPAHRDLPKLSKAEHSRGKKKRHKLIQKVFLNWIKLEWVLLQPLIWVLTTKKQKD